MITIKKKAKYVNIEGVNTIGENRKVVGTIELSIKLDEDVEKEAVSIQEKSLSFIEAIGVFLKDAIETESMMWDDEENKACELDIEL